MSKINGISRMIDLLQGLSEEINEDGGPFAESYVDAASAAVYALPDIKRIVEWVETADHKIHCETENGRECDCGLSEIQSLIRSDK